MPPTLHKGHNMRTELQRRIMALQIELQDARNVGDWDSWEMITERLYRLKADNRNEIEEALNYRNDYGANFEDRSGMYGFD